MSTAKLVLLHAGPEKVINIFVHGYGAVGSSSEFDGLAGNILSARPAGRIYVLFWRSGTWSMPEWVNNATTLIGTAGRVFGPTAAVSTGALLLAAKVVHFKYYESRAEKLGRGLKQRIAHLSHAREYPINLIGYSLGARVIHWALATNDWSSYKIQDCVLLAGATAADDDDWDDCIAEISGTLYVAYSRLDFVLAMKPDGEQPIGRHGVLATQHRVVNREYGYSHRQYWPNLEEILTDLWPGFPQCEASLLPCEECDGSGRVYCDACDDDGEIACEDCDGDGNLWCDVCDGDGQTVCEAEACTEGEVDCERCGGDGEVMCGYCKGAGCGHCDDDGVRSCNDCDGDGTLWCGECDGEGVVACEPCDGEGVVDCDSCEASGYVACEECDEVCQIECEECDGSGAA